MPLKVITPTPLVMMKVTDFGYEIHSQPYDVVALVSRDDKGDPVYITYISKDDLKLIWKTIKENY